MCFTCGVMKHRICSARRVMQRPGLKCGTVPPSTPANARYRQIALPALAHPFNIISYSLCFSCPQLAWRVHCIRGVTRTFMVPVQEPLILIQDPEALYSHHGTLLLRSHIRTLSHALQHNGRTSGQPLQLWQFHHCCICVAIHLPSSSWGWAVSHAWCVFRVSYGWFG